MPNSLPDANALTKQRRLDRVEVELKVNYLLAERKIDLKLLLVEVVKTC